VPVMEGSASLPTAMHPLQQRVQAANFHAASLPHARSHFQEPSTSLDDSGSGSGGEVRPILPCFASEAQVACNCRAQGVVFAN